MMVYSGTMAIPAGIMTTPGTGTMVPAALEAIRRISLSCNLGIGEDTRN